MPQINRYCLNVDQKQKIIQLLEPQKVSKNTIHEDELIAHRLNTILDDLEHRMNTDAWLLLDPHGQVTTTKKAARIARDFNTLSDGLGELAKILGNIDPAVLGHLDENFSLFYFEALQASSPDKTTRHAVLPLNDLISRTCGWARRAEVEVKKDGQSYFDRFFNEIEDFWFYNVDAENISNTKFRKIILILYNSKSEDVVDLVKKQHKRWMAKRRGGDKTKR